MRHLITLIITLLLSQTVGARGTGDLGIVQD